MLFLGRHCHGLGVSKGQGFNVLIILNIFADLLIGICIIKLNHDN